jgi:hypothetical protein
MKFEQRTLQILKNYATINPSLQFKMGGDDGSILTTISPVKTVMAKAKIKESIPSTFAIYDLSRFLGVMSLFDSPEISLDERSLIVSGGNRQVQYTYADPKLIVSPGDKDIKLPDPEISFALTSEVMQTVIKAMGVLGLPEIAITGEGGSIKVQAIDSKNPSGDIFSVDVQDAIYKIDPNAKFRMILLSENMKMLSENYTVNISSKGLAHFVGNSIEYWVATESSSTYSS